MGNPEDRYKENWRNPNAKDIEAELASEVTVHGGTASLTKEVVEHCFFSASRQPNFKAWVNDIENAISQALAAVPENALIYRGGRGKIQFYKILWQVIEKLEGLGVRDKAVIKNFRQEAIEQVKQLSAKSNNK